MKADARAIQNILRQGGIKPPTRKAIRLHLENPSGEGIVKIHLPNCIPIAFVLYSYLPDSKLALLWYFGTHPEYQRKGHMRGLITHTLSPGTPGFLTQTQLDEYNLPAQLLLKSLGFKGESNREGQILFRRTTPKLAIT